MKKVPWNRAIIEEFSDFALLSDEETEVLIARAAGWSRVKASRELAMSLAKIDRITDRLKQKYRSATRYNDFLPENIDF